MYVSLYLDWFGAAPALSTPVKDRMREVLALGPLNPSSAHSEGRAARKVLREARAEVAGALGADPDEVVFTSGVTEGLALAVHGLRRGERTACSRYEHPALRDALGQPETFAYDPNGRPLDPPDAGLFAVALVNHETGMLADLSAVADAAKGAPLIIDAAQATTRARAAWAERRVSALVLSGHKIGGPPGSGVLLVRKGAPFVALVRGGPQEHELRAGTEAVVLAAGYARALSTYAPPDLSPLTATFERELTAARGVRVVAADRIRAPGVTAAYAIGVPARALLEDLDARGVCLAAGAACSAHSNEPSSVLLGLGLSRERAIEVFRVSFGGEEDPVAAARVIKEVIDKRRGEVAERGA